MNKIFGFTKDRRGYYILDHTWKLKHVYGKKPHELGKKLRELTDMGRTCTTLDEQTEFIETQDMWIAEVLEAYLEEFDYSKEVERHDLVVLRQAGSYLFTNLILTGTDPRMVQIFENNAKALMDVNFRDAKTTHSIH